MISGDAPNIAIVDDEADIRSALAQMLQLEGYAPIEFESAQEALTHIDANFPGIVIADLRMPGIDGSALFARLRRCDPDLPVIMMSGHGDIAIAVGLVRDGAYDFLAKPFDGDALLAAVRRALDSRALTMENRRLRSPEAASSYGSIVGESPQAEMLRQTIALLAQADIDVLIVGESGTGKTLIANALHRRSPRGRKALVSIACKALPDTHAESLLFGHASGAFAGAQFPRVGQLLQADGSTVVLDHVDGLPMPLQARLRQTLEDGAILASGATQPQSTRFRTISTTTADLDTLVDSGSFDRSLYFKLGAFRLEVPPLRSRRGDVMILFRTFLADACAELGRDPPLLSSATWKRLQDYDWPGNIRELRSFAANVAHGLGETGLASNRIADAVRQAGLKEATSAFEADIIRSTLSQHMGDVAATIAALQLPRKTFYDKLARHRIDPNDFRPRRVPRP